ncbi:glycine betaine ABC transporter substrate-binding protein [Salisediminibacterium halotolerans]|uniref:Glycine betaine/proline transport system substrate-binding protein n=1 Tax=Salisediminibacterium halotolerans TaxID=517425 RepID=A0A1H9SMQ1_9BACI|nr:glycine betaine ABC transporter substrate-binding protein [Salisediminibacterium haloalkalitolerans]SER86221.1 glycine betaine/proline transport system substrate-binding protein [Salisediminibacterium haloalkalitolerans]
MNFKSKAGLIAGMSLGLVVAGCGDAENNENNAPENDNANNVNNEENNNADNGEEAAGDYGEELDYTITGIDAGAGIMSGAEQALEDYGLEDWSVQASSDAAMTQALADAYENEEPIIVTGWTPHWKFSDFDLKFLEDPELSFGEAEDIETFVRQDLQDDEPEAYEVLDNFNWEGEHMNEVMLEINEGADEDEAARNWVEENEDLVSEWTDGVDEVDGGEIELVLVAWDSEIASTNVVGAVLEDIGYDVTLTPLEANQMFQAVADGQADGMVAAWLPTTHDHLVEDFGDDLDSLGVNLEGAQTGLVVPEYMDIDSIEDLQ